VIEAAGTDVLRELRASLDAEHLRVDQFFDVLMARHCHEQPMPCDRSARRCVLPDTRLEVERLGNRRYKEVRAICALRSLTTVAVASTHSGCHVGDG
jgi:hypothetical protein